MPPARSTLVRMLSKVRFPGEGGCWLWTASLRNGYATISVEGRKVYAHRALYELLVGPIPAGLQLDHVKARGCTNRHCVNPAHLEPVTQAENMRRGCVHAAAHAVNANKTHCPSGHAYSGENLYLDPRGERQCRACQRVRTQAWRERKKNGLPPPREKQKQL